MAEDLKKGEWTESKFLDMLKERNDLVAGLNDKTVEMITEQLYSTDEVKLFTEEISKKKLVSSTDFTNNKQIISHKSKVTLDTKCMNTNVTFDNDQKSLISAVDNIEDLDYNKDGSIKNNIEKPKIKIGKTVSKGFNKWIKSFLKSGLSSNIADAFGGGVVKELSDFTKLVGKTYNEDSRFRVQYDAVFSKIIANSESSYSSVIDSTINKGFNIRNKSKEDRNIAEKEANKLKLEEEEKNKNEADKIQEKVDNEDLLKRGRRNIHSLTKEEFSKYKILEEEEERLRLYNKREKELLLEKEEKDPESLTDEEKKQLEEYKEEERIKDEEQTKKVRTEEEKKADQEKIELWIKNNLKRTKEQIKDGTIDSEKLSVPKKAKEDKDLDKEKFSKASMDRIKAQKKAKSVKESVTLISDDVEQTDDDIIEIEIVDIDRVKKFNVLINFTDFVLNTWKPSGAMKKEMVEKDPSIGLKYYGYLKGFLTDINNKIDPDDKKISTNDMSIEAYKIYKDNDKNLNNSFAYMLYLISLAKMSYDENKNMNSNKSEQNSVYRNEYILPAFLKIIDNKQSDVYKDKKNVYFINEEDESAKLVLNIDEFLMNDLEKEAKESKEFKNFLDSVLVNNIPLMHKNINILINKNKRGNNTWNITEIYKGLSKAEEVVTNESNSNEAIAKTGGNPDKAVVKNTQGVQ